ncbi:polysaccharide deacetylase family protein [Celeribacter litoreus]|uniref:polysaccharide deacetylase family protein n=1 Tax=Celeribacter litoreus TaxID=2876714 RepID=UPI001CCD725B|nr:polysaccharide deacetylase family protein [Celeribacter litoreus]MCA0042511.1 polysaccharide deacetylase family protein [Celeribacter litoreus]
MTKTDFSWPDGKKLAISIVVNIEEGSELSIKEGDKKPEPVDELGVALRIPIRNYINESNYAYGINEGARRVFDLLEAREMDCTVTAAALSLERAPALAARIVENGYEVCSHGYRWVHQFSFDEEREREFISKAATSIESTCGARPQGWLSRYLHTDNTHRLLLEEGYSYHMDNLSSDLPFWEEVAMTDGSTKPLLCVPYAIDTNDMKMWTSPSYTPEQWLAYNIQSFDWYLREARELGPRMTSVGLHLRIIGRPGRIWALEKFLDHVDQFRDEVWITSRAKIAESFMSAHPFSGG